MIQKETHKQAVSAVTRTPKGGLIPRRGGTYAQDLRFRYTPALPALPAKSACDLGRYASSCSIVHNPLARTRIVPVGCVPIFLPVPWRMNQREPKRTRGREPIGPLLVDFAIFYHSLIRVDPKIIGILAIAVAHLISPRLLKWSPVAQKS